MDRVSKPNNEDDTMFLITSLRKKKVFVPTPHYVCMFIDRCSNKH